MRKRGGGIRKMDVYTNVQQQNTNDPETLGTKFGNGGADE